MGETGIDSTGVNTTCTRGRPCDERGEGVISTAIAVLIVALLGAALWIGFNQIVTDATDRTSDQIEQIGS